MTRYTPLWEQAGSYAASVDRRLIGAVWPSSAVIGCAVTVSAGTMNMNIAAGTVVAPAANNTGSVLCYSDAVEIVTSPAAPGSGSNRYDVVVCQPRGNDLDGGANNDFVFSVVSGTASASPSVPATPAGAVALAQVLVIGGSASLTSGNLADVRPLGRPGSQRLAYVQSTVNFGPTTGTTEAVITGLTTPAVYIPTATRLVRVETYIRNFGGVTTGDAALVRIREGTTTGGTEIQDGISNLVTAGPQIGNGSHVMVARTYAPGVGLKQWSVTLAGAANPVTAFTAGASSPMWLEITDMGG